MRKNSLWFVLSYVTVALLACEQKAKPTSSTLDQAELEKQQLIFNKPDDPFTLTIGESVEKAVKKAVQNDFVCRQFPTAYPQTVIRCEENKTQCSRSLWLTYHQADHLLSYKFNGGCQES